MEGLSRVLASDDPGNRRAVTVLASLAVDEEVRPRVRPTRRNVPEVAAGPETDHEDPEHETAGGDGQGRAKAISASPGSDQPWPPAATTTYCLPSAL